MYRPDPWGRIWVRHMQCVYVCVNTHMQILSSYTHICMHIHKCLFIYCIHTHIHIYVYIHIYMCVCVCVFVFMNYDKELLYPCMSMYVPFLCMYVYSYDSFHRRVLTREKQHKHLADKQIHIIMEIFVYMYIHTQTIYTHTHTHTHKQAKKKQQQQLVEASAVAVAAVAAAKFFHFAFACIFLWVCWILHQRRQRQQQVLFVDMQSVLICLYALMVLNML